MLDESLKNKIFQYLQKHFNTGIWTVIGTGIESRESVVYRISNKTYEHDFALKVYRKTYNKEHIYHTFKASAHYGRTLNSKNSRYSAPNTYKLFPEDNCFLMEWIDGITLRQQLWNKCFSKSMLQKHIIDATLWAKNYHQVSNPSVKPIDISRYISTLENHANKSTEQTVTRSTVFKKGFDALKDFSKSFIGFETLHADIHGDLHLSNLIIDESHIFGIDIKAKMHLPIEDDLTQMLNYICINYFNMLTRFDIRKPLDTWEIFNVVLDSYGYTRSPKSRDFFLFVFLYQMLFRWVHIADTHKSSMDKSFVFYILGKWRHYNSRVIVNNITEIINKKIT